MDDRTMPLATFRCPESGHQATVRLSVMLRVAGMPDYVLPVPTCPDESCPRFGRKMTPMQYDYSGGD